ncbi:MAG: GNA1162 family protein [Thermodesulfobacteriota bacterium]
MKIPVIILTFALLLFGCVHISSELLPETQFDKTSQIAILPFVCNDVNIGTIIPYSMTQELLKSNIKVVERTYLQSILREQGLDLTGALQKVSLEKIGKLADCDYLIVGSVETYKLWYGFFPATVSCKMIDIKTGSITWTGSFYQNIMSLDRLVAAEIGKRLAKELVNKVYKPETSH